MDHFRFFRNGPYTLTDLEKVSVPILAIYGPLWAIIDSNIGILPVRKKMLSVAFADGKRRQIDRGDPALSKWPLGFDSRLMMGSPGVKVKLGIISGFDTLLPRLILFI